jgi:metal-responsive CopG/Arc/MetJ family transcriptional regulator
METQKTAKVAVSLPEPLFQEAEALARDMGLARSQLYALALQAYLLEHESRQLLDQLNEAYDDGADVEETLAGQVMPRHHRRTVAGEW